MPVNFNLLRRDGPANFAEGLMQGQDQQNALLQQQQQRQLGDVQLRNALRGEQEAMAESEAVKGSASLEDLAGRYRKAGLGKQALATEAALAKQRTDKLAAAKTQFELLKSSATRIMANPAAAVSELQRYQQLTGVDMSDDIAQIQQMPPDQVKAWASGHALEADKLLPKFQSMSVPGVGVQTGTTDYTGAFTPGQVFKEQMSEAQKAQNKIAQGQLAVSQGNLNVAQQRLAQDAQGVTYQQDAQGNIMALPSRLASGGAPVARPVTGQDGAAVKGKPSAFAEKATAQRTQMGKDIKLAITEIEDAIKPGGLLEKSTASGAGKLVDVGAAFFGQATPGAIAAASLKPIADLGLKMIPRFEGPQSDKDTASYKEAAGQLANEALPTATRKSAAQTMIRIMKARQGQFANDVMAAEGIAPSIAPPPGFTKD